MLNLRFEVGGMSALFGLIPAGGTGSRFGGELPKQYAALAGETVMARTARALLADPRIMSVLVATAPGDAHVADALAPLRGEHGRRLTWVPAGGATRARTVRQGLDALLMAGALESDWVLVHDAARPGLSPDALMNMIDRLQTHPVGGLMALPLADTLKRSRFATDMASEEVEATIPREAMWAAQTPQMFRIGLLAAALDAAFDAGIEPTDEAQAMEAAGHVPVLVPGTRGNFKITVQDDLRAMEQLMSNSSLPRALPSFRIGEGWDVHALVAGRKLIIGGVEIPHNTGLLGHSDADVLLHAITDALLGGAGVGDIGRHFPDTDPQFKGADSKVLLAEAYRRVQAAGWQLVNLDATIIAQQPKLAPHIPGMVAVIAQTLGVDASQINVKAKTSEKLGYLGREEGISAQASALLVAR
jgi:2-C-methyl-D-erythritol 4-phosphate cytidylyltransferase/2-C-methyl-D-erythritol 2,4-cyclodiphosphate synthase